MPEAPPIIYAPPTRPLRATLYGRLVALAVAVCCAYVIYHAVTLTPNPSGVGTHRGMGLKACNMLTHAGVPCPTCGMTTSFTWFYRGNFHASLYVQPAGFFLAYISGMLFSLALYEAATGRPIHRLLRLLNLRYAVIIVLSVLLAGWGWKILLHFTGNDGWP